MNKSIMLIIWYKDEPPTGNIQNLKSIEKPRKDLNDYAVGDYVTAKCQGYGLQPGVIGKICDDSQKGELVKLINGDEFPLLVETILSKGHTTEEDTEPSGHESKLEIQQKDTQVEKSQEKNKSKLSVKRELEASQVKTDEAKKARIEKRRQERLIESQKDRANKIASKKLLESAPSAPSTSTDEIAATLAVVVNEQQQLKKTMETVMTKLDAITAMATCQRCVKALYKDCRIPKNVSSPPITKFLTAIPQSPEPTEIATTDGCINIDADHDSAADEDSSTEVKVADHQLPSTSDAITDISSDLVYLGEARYGIKILKDHLHSARATSKDPVKYGLNLLEFIVTRAECKEKLTLYGEGRGTKAMPSHKVLALQSEIFSQFHRHDSRERQKEIWKKDVVLSLNNKIRGIRNGKYPGVTD